MKMKNQSTGGLIMAFTLALNLHSSGSAQELLFTDVRATEERAVQLHWQSETNTVYRVDYADELLDVSLGGPVWKKLFDNYPSHGTNTLILDSGNYDVSPAIPHPKYTPMRFYRITNLGTNTSDSNPTVVITSPSSGAPLSGEVTVAVSAHSDQVLSSVKLYVDGEEMYDSDDGTNFVINTCEWPNGPHVLFAVAKSQSGWTGLPNDNSVTSGSAVSAYVNVTFTNLITRYDFGLPFFDPDQGQTQTVSAVFAANVDWTLEVQDTSSNTVRSTTGSGSSMTWDFDGYDSNGVKLIPAFYWYVLTAQTNGQQMMMSGGDSFSVSSALLSDTMELWAMQGSGVSVPLAIYPPGFDTNHLNIFEASQSEVFALNKAMLTLNSASKTAESSAVDSGGGAAAEAYGGAASQSTKGPQRKPKERHIGVKGSFGVLYQDASLRCDPPRLAIPLPPYFVKIDGNPTGARLNNDGEPRVADIAKTFVSSMKNSGYTNSWIKGSYEWTVDDLKGAGASINSVNLGLVIAHASYGETYQNPQEGIYHTYTWLSEGTYVKLGDMRLGGSGPNGLRWLTMLTCNTLREQNLQSYNNHSYLPLIIGDNMHLLLSAETIMSGTENTALFYAQNLKKGETIPNAWYKALRDSIAKASTKPDGNRVARVIGHPPCFSDKLMDWQDPDTGINSASNQVYP